MTTEGDGLSHLLFLVLGAIELNRIVLAFRAFFNLLFSGELSAETLISLNLSRRSGTVPAKAAAPVPAAPAARATDGALQMGVIVDEVSEVSDVRAEEIDPTPDFGGNFDTRFILGMGKVNGTVIILLDIDQVLSADELIMVDGLAG